jgi:hypothetical protein
MGHALKFRHPNRLATIRRRKCSVRDKYKKQEENGKIIVEMVAAWTKTPEWSVIFGDKALSSVLLLLKTLKRMKGKQGGTGRKFKKISCRPRNRHHLKPKSRGGDDRTSNLLLIAVHKHVAWHRLFKDRGKDMTIGEIVDRLAFAHERLRKLKCSFFA